jgi:hypothetical protein
LQGFDFRKQAVSAQAAFGIGRHRDFGQLRAPAAAFQLAVHCRSTLCATRFHVAMMAQLWRGVQRG